MTYMVISKMKKKILVLAIGLIVLFVLVSPAPTTVAQECAEGYVAGDSDGDGIPDVCDPVDPGSEEEPAESNGTEDCP
jgi:hypothetical protein